MSNNVHADIYMQLDWPAETLVYIARVVRNRHDDSYTSLLHYWLEPWLLLEIPARLGHF